MSDESAVFQAPAETSDEAPMSAAEAEATGGEEAAEAGAESDEG